jgi:uroporphyrin-III C-methyltransferase/precorrin-2 dehydrogenase/sirohydrochlorin ferrochelatase
LRTRFAEGAERRRAVDAGLREGGPLDPFDASAHMQVEAWVAGDMSPRAGGVIELTLTSADPEDLTLRQARLLGEADVVLLDGAAPPAILARARADAARLVWDGSTPPSGGAGLTLLLRYRPAD